MSELHLRPAVRGLLIDPSDRVLLVKVSFRDWHGWLTPGGGIDPGEDHPTALRRELLEETGLSDPNIGPPLWVRRVIPPKLYSEYDGQEETVYLVPCQNFVLAPSMTPAQLEAEGVIGHHWWTLDELDALDGAEVRPHDLAHRVRHVLEFGAPTEPERFEDRQA